VKLIDDWRRAHRFLSMWVALFVGLFIAIEQFSPSFAEFMPDWWPGVGAALFALARVLKQHGFDRPVVSERVP